MGLQSKEDKENLVKSFVTAGLDQVWIGCISD